MIKNETAGRKYLFAVMPLPPERSCFIARKTSKYRNKAATKVASTVKKNVTSFCKRGVLLSANFDVLALKAVPNIEREQRIINEHKGLKTE